MGGGSPCGKSRRPRRGESGRTGRVGAGRADKLAGPALSEGPAPGARTFKTAGPGSTAHRASPECQGAGGKGRECAGECAGGKGRECGGAGGGGGGGAGGSAGARARLLWSGGLRGWGAAQKPEAAEAARAAPAEIGSEEGRRSVGADCSLPPPFSLPSFSSRSSARLSFLCFSSSPLARSTPVFLRPLPLAPPSSSLSPLLSGQSPGWAPGPRLRGAPAGRAGQLPFLVLNQPVSIRGFTWHT